ncbi:AlbA family DNA-binding domain-containing protein [Leifsonia naganoensis]|uniref:Schlafen AlbA-2 domain-containing protein n=1 Tax=Leifsonia naganoensis TaxID=150025 RepID=A0A853DTU2_9MICO|nr:hypothetical protein [Leifsonia naganoensis]NYK09075.1 hypothetical protein [Leifsonia naganoensis]
MIDFDVSRLPTRVAEWSELLAAIFEATPNDEAYWVEWKSTYSWENRAHLGAVARAIIAMANRDPDEAATHLGGNAIVVVGLEPGVAHGVNAIDSTVLENKLDAFTGGREGPRWIPHWLRFRELVVLVIQVMPPRRGQPPFVLTSSVDKLRVGQVFTRVGSKSEPATPADLRRLAARFLPADPEPILPIRIRAVGVDRYPTYWWDKEGIEAFIESERRSMLESLNADRLSRVLTAGAAIPPAFPSLLHRPEDRTEEQYLRHVESHLARIREMLPDTLRSVAASVFPAVEIVADNLGSTNLKDIHVTLSVSGDAHAEDSNEDRRLLAFRLPDRPRSFGPYLPDPTFRVAIPPVVGSFGRREIRNGGSFVVELDAFDLRPSDHGKLVDVRTVVLIPKARTGPVTMTWRATASNVDAEAGGEFELDFSGPSIDVLTLSQRQASEDDGV